MLEHIYGAIPIVIVLLAYFVRIEIRFTRLTTDVSWIKTALGNIQCRQNPSKSE